MSVFDKFKNVNTTSLMAIGGAVVSGIVAFATAMIEHNKEQAIEARFTELEDRFAALEQKDEEA
jgi:hypothetical protein